jgi:hypothetical protein
MEDVLVAGGLRRDLDAHGGELEEDGAGGGPAARNWYVAGRAPAAARYTSREDRGSA